MALCHLLAIWSLLLVGAHALSAQQIPRKRPFVPLPAYLNVKSDAAIIRVQQFNVLADGLSGLRQDLGSFSRATSNVLNWDSRKQQLLHELTQYDADVITLQECDHFHDWFQPKLAELGYIGYFASKPTSGCLDVSSESDGCALFVKKDKFRVISCESKSLALSIARLQDGELQEDETAIKAQNQVAIIAVLELINGKNNKNNNSPTAMDGGRRYDPTTDYDTLMSDIDIPDTDLDSPPPLVIGTAHLKSSKTSTGERYRQKGILKILAQVQQISDNLGMSGRQPAVILTGDLNAVSSPTYDQSRRVFGSKTYPPLTWNAIKLHSLDLRSVYQDDVTSVLEGIDYSTHTASGGGGDIESVAMLDGKEKVLPTIVRQNRETSSTSSSTSSSSSSGVYTTWKARSPRQRGFSLAYNGNSNDNDDIHDDGDEGEDTRVSAKGANGGGDDHEVKRCIDYIFYSPYRTGPVNPLYYRSRTRGTLARNAIIDRVMNSNGNGNYNGNGNSNGNGNGNGNGTGAGKYDEYGNNVDRTGSSNVQRSADKAKATNLIIPATLKPPLVATSIDQVVISLLLRSAVYSFGALIPIVAIIDSSLSTAEKALVVLLGVIGLTCFEVSSRGTIFKPQIRDENVIESIDNNVSKYAGSEYTNEEAVNDGASYYTYSYTGRVYTNSLMLRRQLLEKVGTISKKLATESYGRPGVQPLAILDLYSEKEIGEELLPNERYPSDHLSIGVDFEIIW